MSSPPAIQLIRGGPGAGKTACLVQTIREAILSEGLAPVRILALALDRAAQQRLREHLAQESIAARSNLMPLIYTYEKIAEQILQESHSHWERGIIYPLAERLLIGQTIRQTASGARYYRDERLRDSSRFRDDVADFIAELKRCKITPEVFREQIIPGLPSAEALEDLADIYQQYQQRLQEAGVYDIRGIVWLALEALKDKQLAARWQQRYDLVVADDLQDATLLQIELLAAICGPQTRLVAAYEPAQAIYRFRGAVEDAAKLLEMLLPQRQLAQETLHSAGRLSVQVAAVAQRFARDQQLPTAPAGQSGQPGATEVRVYRSLAEELVGIGDDLLENLQRPDATPEQFAVIARRHNQVQTAVQHLALRGIPVAGYEQVVGHWSAVGILTDIIDLLLYLRHHDRYEMALRQQKLAAANRATARLATLSSAESGIAMDLARICHHCTDQRRFMLPEKTTSPRAPLRSGEGPRVRSTALQEWQAVVMEALNLSAVEGVSKIITATGLIPGLADHGADQTLAGLARILQTIQDTEDAFTRVAGHGLELVQIRAIVEIAEAPPAPAEGVAVLTAHAARGREFETVYVIGLNEGTFPAPPVISRLVPPATVAALRRRTLAHLDIPTPALTFAGFGEAPQEAYAEETRLFYTCLTRATQRLVLTCHREEEGSDISPAPFLASALPADFALASATEQQTADFECVFAGLAPETAGGRTDHEGCPITVCAGRPPETAPAPVAAQVAAGPRPSRKPVLAEVADRWAASASSLNDYFLCPRRFFFAHLLRLETEEHDAMTYGSVIHRFLAELNARCPAERTPQAAPALLEKALGGAASAFSSEYAFRVYQQRAQDSLEAYIDSDYFAEPSVAQERCFTVELEDKEGRPHRFTGRIDQVAQVGDDVVVIDYKTGSVPSPAATRRSFCYRSDQDQAQAPTANYQLPLYVLGWELERGAAGAVSQVGLQSFGPPTRQGTRRVTVEVIDGAEPGKTQFTRKELAQIARHLAETALTIKNRRGFEGHPPAEGCNPYMNACPFILICSEAEPG